MSVMNHKKSSAITQLINRWVRAFLLPVPMLGLVFLPKYLMQYIRFRRLDDSQKVSIKEMYPCLLDRVHNTPFDPHYFYQAAWLSRCIARSKVMRHVDIGSDIRIFNVLSAFVTVDFADFRPLQVKLDGLNCSSANITNLTYEDNSINSLSCLHVVEHVGLGRYGDPLDVKGAIKSLHELQRVLAPKGKLYLSVPVGRERVCFNAHRVFYPKTIINHLSSLNLVEFSLVDDSGDYQTNVPIDLSDELDYGCGMFIFEKI